MAGGKKKGSPIVFFIILAIIVVVALGFLLFSSPPATTEDYVPGDFYETGSIEGYVSVNIVPAPSEGGGAT